MSEDINKNSKADIRKISFYVLLVLAIGAFFFLKRYEVKDGDNYEKEYTYIDNWTVTDSQGNSFEVGRTYSDNRAFTEDFTVVSVLPDHIVHDSILCFGTRGNVEVYIGGVLRNDFNSTRDVRLPGGHAKSFYLLTPITSDDEGKELRLERHRTDRIPIVAPETVITSRGGLYTYLASKHGVTFLMAFILAVASLIVIITGVVMRVWYRQKINMMYAAFGILTVSGWIIFVSQLFPFIFGNRHIDGIMSFICCLMMPFAFLIYIDLIQKERYHRYYNILYVISLINLLVWSILHFAGVFSFAQSLKYLDFVLVLIMLSVFVLFIVDYRSGHMSEYRYTANGFIGFFAFALIEIIMLVFFQSRSNEIPMLCGLMTLLVFVVVQQVADLRMISIEKQRAEELSDAKTKFLAGMSHEIRTPINAILGMNEMILRETHDGIIEGYAENIRSSGRMLLSLVNDVLDFSKIESGRMEIVKVDCSLREMIGQIEPIVMERAKAKGLAYRMVIAEGVPDSIHTDDVRLKQVLINLINNAIKYTDKGSVTLNVSGRYRGEEDYELKLDVKDTGTGIREEDQKKLFEAFSRVDLNRNRNVEGTGLGLAIVKNVVDSMDGTISVESVYHEGSVFSVVVPVKVTRKDPQSEQSPDNPDAETDKASASYIDDTDYVAPDAMVLVVDDNSTNLNIVRLFLKKNRIEPVLCLSGEEAIRKCRETKYDLLLLDHMMKEPDGIETLKRINGDEESLNRDTPAVVLTANAVAGSRQMYIEAGFAEYLTKPLDPILLERTIRKYLPQEKVLDADDSASDDSLNDHTADHGNGTVENIREYNGKEQGDNVIIKDVKGGYSGMSLEEKLSVIEGFDYETALTNSAGEEDFLKEILSEIPGECEDRIGRMKKSLEEGNYKNYCVEAHAIKSLMATIGVKVLSERGRKHEFASRDGDIDFVKSDCDAFYEDYRKVCSVITQALEE